MNGKILNPEIFLSKYCISVSKTSNERDEGKRAVKEL